MRPLLASILFLLFLDTFYGQNLAPNSSFEDFLEAVCGIIDSPAEFNGNMNDWYTPTEATPQIFFTTIDPSCYNYQPESQYNGPIGIKGDQLPRSGTVLTGLWLYTIEGLNQRHYVQSQLEEPMYPGTDYVVEFYVSLGDYMESSTDRIGAYLSPEAVMLDTDSILPLSPQVNANDFVSDVSSWTRIADTIQVTEECHFITIGNFFADDMTSTLPNPSASGAPGTYGAFYFLDDIRVEALTSLGVDEFVTERFSLYPSLVKDILTVELTEKFGIEVYDSQGQLILSQIMTIGRHYIDMSKYASGSYRVLFKSSDHLESKQIIKR